MQTRAIVIQITKEPRIIENCCPGVCEGRIGRGGADGAVTPCKAKGTAKSTQNVVRAGCACVLNRTKTLSTNSAVLKKTSLI